MKILEMVADKRMQQIKADSGNTVNIFENAQRKPAVPSFKGNGD